jgi:neurobeachin-like protein 1/2
MCFVKKNTGVAEKLTLHVYSVNGKHMSFDSVSFPITDMTVSGGHLVYGDVQGNLVIKELYGYVLVKNRLF